MNKTVYAVFHIYEVDGGFGDAVAQEDFVFATEDKEAAEGYVEKYNNLFRHGNMPTTGHWRIGPMIVDPRD